MDYEIDLNTLQSKNSELLEIKTKAEDIYNEFNSGYLNKLANTDIRLITAYLRQPIERLKKGVTNSNTWYTNYCNELDSLENTLASFNSSNLESPKLFNSKFEDLFSKNTMPILKSNGDIHANAVATPTVTDKGDGTITVEALGKKYTVANTKAELYDYLNNVILSQSLYQEASKKFDDQCLGFSYNYAYGLYANDRSINSSTIRNGTSYGNHFKKFNTYDASELLDKVYSEITAGKPVVIQVTGSRKNQTRHYVTVVGFNSNVKSAKDLKLTDLLIMDVYDGKIKNTVGKKATSGRCVVKGTELKKGKYPYGYEMYYINS